MNSKDISEEMSPVQWRVTEITFTGSKTYGNSFNEVDVDVVFTHTNGTELRIPAFWDDGNTWNLLRVIGHIKLSAQIP